VAAVERSFALPAKLRSRLRLAPGTTASPLELSTAGFPRPQTSVGKPACRQCLPHWYSRGTPGVASCVATQGEDLVAPGQSSPEQLLWLLWTVSELDPKGPPEKEKRKTQQ